MSEQAMSASEKKKEDWMNAKWRPMMGWMYMAVCMADFVLFPVLWSLVQATHGGQVTSQWNPITLQGAGLFHMAMGAILGIAAFGRTQEKLAGANNGGAGLASAAPSPATVAAAPAFGTPPPVAAAPQFGAPVQVASAPVFTSSTGKPMPAPQVDPQI